ncbi:von Willebrand factor A domain-containing protein 5A [Acipenser ruthenus]|uniref:von Willebrand factor A domain-containing protein 5A n=1 Tax=Acipenser ruthenus TaxID=7906 RepID=A0A444V7D4_ACIRT|nr:von Willebrand factor A domain-containing protein 5A [Acipenser ruthenus]
MSAVQSSWTLEPQHYELVSVVLGRLTTHRLAARTLICSLEEGGSVEGEGGDKEKVKEKVVKISTEARVISTHTAFIAVNKDLNRAVQGPLIQRNMRPQNKEDPMLTLISLQKADGSWELNESLVSVFEKEEQEAISKMPAEVMQSLRFALQPAVNNIVLNWDVPAGLEVVPVSETPKVLFRGHRSILYAQLKGKFDESAVGLASLQYSLGDEPHKTEISFKLQSDKHTGLTTHRLAARTLICSLEEGGSVEGEGGDKEKVKEKVVKISTEARVISTHTAFIAVNKDLNQAVQGPLIHRNMWPQSECLSTNQSIKTFIYPDESIQNKFSSILSSPLHTVTMLRR